LKDQAKLAGRYVSRQITRLAAGGHDSAAKATLARLRRGIGSAPGGMPELWESTLKGLPEELQSRDGTPTYGEWAVHTALTLYALHQQGKDSTEKNMQKEGESLGSAVGKLIRDEEADLPRVKRRFDAAATADSLTEFSHHLRGLTQIMKAQDIPLDYVMLAEDLYWFQFPHVRDKIRLKWGQDFYNQFSRRREDEETVRPGSAEENQNDEQEEMGGEDDE